MFMGFTGIRNHIIKIGDIPAEFSHILIQASGRFYLKRFDKLIHCILNTAMFKQQFFCPAVIF